MDELKELFVNFHKILNNKAFLTKAFQDKLFYDDYVGMFLLAMDYYNLLKIPAPIIKMCLDCEMTSEEDWNEIVCFASDLWERKAQKAINNL